MSITLTISDELAAALENRREQAGISTINEAAEFLLSYALEANAADFDDLGLSQESLRALVIEGEASGPALAWNRQSVREEIRRRFAARQSG